MEKGVQISYNPLPRASGKIYLLGLDTVFYLQPSVVGYNYYIIIVMQVRGVAEGRV